MNTTELLRGALCAVMTLSACSGKDPAATATATATSTSTSTATSTSTSKGSTGATTTWTSATTGTTATSDLSETGTPSATSDDTDNGCSFIDCSDHGDIEEQCDVWSQDCPEGEKCMPWADNGGSSWNALKCVPVDPAPQQPGEACIAEDAVSGVDNCEKGSMCWNVDPETDEGSCIAFCEGDSEDATCDPGFTCIVHGDGVLILCMPTCDPLLQDCPRGQACIPQFFGTLDWGLDFLCTYNWPDEGGSYGDPCQSPHACKAGLTCVSAEYVEGCQDEGCCSPFCDTSDPNICPGESQECIPWYEEGEAPMGYENVGVCGVVQ